MGRLLAALLADAEPAGPANPAKVANPTPARLERFADSQDSQGVDACQPSAPDAIRARLHRIAGADGLPAACVDSIPDDELPQYDEWADEDLRLPLHLRARRIVTPLRAGETK